ncbi:TPA: hypothetical protein DEG21_04385 [Patescibacteria group bacterium]|nr:hypothetical protein [Candidatus Gracilibacteria bacterium]HBY75074.1 hypothetical protein [Candidatus Gracilibacteria bacterium]
MLTSVASVEGVGASVSTAGVSVHSVAGVSVFSTAGVSSVGTSAAGVSVAAGVTGVSSVGVLVPQDVRANAQTANIANNFFIINLIN